jgi:hypothetical protein
VSRIAIFCNLSIRAGFDQLINMAKHFEVLSHGFMPVLPAGIFSYQKKQFG